MSSTLKKRGNKGEYINLSAYDFIKWLSNHRGGHAFELKACAARWINHAEIKRRALRELAEEISPPNDLAHGAAGGTKL
jgi:hypothetical protein